MDAVSQRKTWDLINSQKKNKTVIITTHFLEEAEDLADRIGVMHLGKPYILKKSSLNFCKIRKIVCCWKQ